MWRSEGGWLQAVGGGSLTVSPTPNQGGPLSRGQDLLAVVHYTATGNVSSAAEHFLNPRSEVSCHCLISRGGDVVQFVPFHRVAWHAGRSYWKGVHGVNSVSIGIELENPGRLRREGDCGVSWFGKKYALSDLVEQEHPRGGKSEGNLWLPYTEIQLQALTDLLLLLKEQGLVSEIVGHDDVAPGRKWDPGPHFPMERVRAAVFAAARSELTLAVSAEPQTAVSTSPPDSSFSAVRRAQVVPSRLNIRSGPGSNFERIESCAEAGQWVEILEERAGWSRVRVVQEGWVSSRYLKGGDVVLQSTRKVS